MQKTEFIKKYLYANSMITDKEGSPFYDELIKLPEEGRMLEIGTGQGASTLFFAKLKPKWTIYTVDIFGMIPFSTPNEKWLPRDKKGITSVPMLYTPYKRDTKVMFDRWKERGANNIIPILANSRTLHWELELDALFLDGDHYYEGVKSDFDKFSPFVKKGGVIMFHDAILDAYYCQVHKFLKDEVKPKMRLKIEGNVAIAYK